MSIQELEKTILAEAKIVLGVPDLKMSDILEWSTGGVDVVDGECQFYLPKQNVNIAISNTILYADDSASMGAAPSSQAADVADVPEKQDDNTSPEGKAAQGSTDTAEVPEEPEEKTHEKVAREAEENSQQ